MGRACCEKKRLGTGALHIRTWLEYTKKKKTQVFSYLNKVIINIENKLYDCLSLLAGDSFQASAQEIEIKPRVGALN